jgi:hypothetical protein
MKCNTRRGGSQGMRATCASTFAEKERLPFFRQHQLRLESTNNGNTAHIVVRDVNEPASGKPVWQRDKPVPPMVTYFGNPVNFRFNNVPQHNVRFTYHACGHVVVDLAHMVYAFDPIEKRDLWEYNLYKPGTAESPSPAQIVHENGDSFILYPDNFKQRLGTVGPVAPGYVCLHTRNGLMAVDPVKGPANTLWTKSDVPPKTRVFGDAEHIYLVDVNADGKAITAHRAVRASDGATISVPEFAGLYQRHLSIRGRTLLAHERSDQEELVFRLYDVHTGKDLWRKELPAKSILIKSEDADLCGGVTPDGEVLVYDARSQKEVLKGTVKKELLAKHEGIHLMADRDIIYLFLNQPTEPLQGLWGGGISANVSAGMPFLKVNGNVYAFDRSTGARVWENALTNQMLVLEQFHDLPVLVFTVKYRRNVNMRGIQMFQVVEVIDKRSGKFVWSPKQKEAPSNMQPIHAIKCDAKTGVVELVQSQRTLRFKLQPAEEK